jgi:hypothetical protein
MNLDEMEEVLVAREAKEAANKAMAQRWLGNHNLGGDISKGWSYPCKNNCHSHCQSGPATCKCPCHDDSGWGSC